MKCHLLLATHLATFLTLHAAPDTVDPIFAASAGHVFDPAASGGVSSILVQPDGKILFGSNEMPGDFSGTTRRTALTRFNPDGSVDSYFFADNEPTGSDSGIFFDDAGFSETHALGLQSDGKIIAAGVMQGVRIGTKLAPSLEFRSKSIVRFNSDGSIDPSFQTNGTAPSTGFNFIEDITIASDDKIYAVGGFGGFRDSETDPYTTRYGIARLNANGSLDTTFQLDPAEFGVPAGAPNLSGFFREAAVDPSGKIYIGGSFQYGFGFPQTTIPVIARVFPDGKLDTSFKAAVPANTYSISGLEIEPDGRVVVLGHTNQFQTESFVVRLQPDGALDPSFTLDPLIIRATARPLQRDAAGRYLLAVPNISGTAPLGVLIRITSTGAIDPTFRAEGDGTANSFFNTFTTGANGRIYGGIGAGAQINGVETIKLVGFEGDAQPSTLAWSSTFVTPAESSGSVILSVTRSGDLSAPASVSFATAPGTATGADFTATSGTLTWPAGVGGVKSFAVPLINDAAAESNETFTLTLSSATGATIASPTSISVTLLDDDSPPVIVSPPASLTVKEGQPAWFTVAVSSAVPPTYQWRKNGDNILGATSPSYLIPATTMASDADYSVVVTTPGGSIPSAAASLTVIPPAAVPESGINISGVAVPGAFALLADDSLLMLDSSTFNLRKLDASFAVDPSFTVTTTPDSGFTASNAYPNPIPLPNGQFLATGFFSHVNGVSRKRLARLDADGTLDTDFVPFFNSGSFPVNTFTAFYNGLSGVHAGASGTVYALVRSSNQGNRLFRLLPDGAADPAFSIAFNYSTNANFTGLAELSNGSILIGYTAGGTFERGIRKVLANGTFDPAFPRFNTSSNVTGFVLLGGDRFAAIHGNLLTIHNLADGSLLETHTFTGTLTSIQPYRGRLLLTGPTAFNGTALSGMALFSLNGTADDNFPGGAGPNANVVQSAIDAQGRILVRGNFSTWNGIATPGFARLIVDRAEVGFATNVASPIEDAGPLSIGLVRFGNTSEAASVRITTLAGTATAPADFAALDQIVTWAAGDATPKTVALALVDDALLEGDESLTLQLSDATSSSIIPGSLTVTIRDDDSLPKITAPPVEIFAVLGKPATLSVTATSPTTLSYQWFLNGQIISGATAASYPITAVSTLNEGSYTVRLTNEYGAIFSAAVDLTIIPDPAALAPGFASLALNSNVVALDVAPDGAAVIAGFFTDVGGNPDIDYIAKIDASGNLDPLFVPAPITSGSVFDVALQADGKVVIVGSFYTVGGQNLRGMARLNANGSLDTDFAANIVSGANGSANAVDLLPDGRVVFGGQFTSWNNQNVGTYGAVRVNTDGTFSGTYSKSDTRTIQAIKTLPDGGVLISANTTSSSAVKVYRYDSSLQQQAFTYASGRTRVDAIDLAADGDYLFAGNGQVLKINPDGSTDQSAILTSVTEVAAQTNGSYLAGGGSGTGRNIRYLANGTIDPNFDGGTGFNNTVNDLGVRLDGKIWVGGTFTSYKGTPVNYLALLNGDPIPLAITVQPAALTIVDPGENVTLSVAATGTTALSYQWFRGNDPLSDQPGISGSQTTTLSLSAVDEADAGNYTVVVTNEAGTRTSTVAQLIVLGAPEILSLSGDISLLEGSPLSLEVEAIGAGTLDYQWFRGTTPLPLQTSATLFIPSASASDAGNYSVVVTNNIDSTPSGPIGVTVRPNSALAAPGFTPPTVVGSPVNQVLPLPGGRVLVGGNFTSISDGTNTSGARLAVVDETGAVIPVAGLSADGIVESLRLQADGKILIAGNFNTIGGTPRGKLARLNENLTLDPGFNPTGLTGSFSSANDLAQEAGGTLIAVGGFTDFGGEPTADYAVRLNDDGSYNNTFTSGANSTVYRVFPQPGGDLIFSGWFTWAAGTEQFVVRTDAAGAVDPATDYNLGFYYSTDAFQLANGDMLTSYAFGNAVFRLAPNGTSITPFPAGGGITGIVRAFAESPTGDLLLGGAITAAAGQPAGRIILLNADNTRDIDFHTGTGFNSNVNDIAVAPSGRIWVGGEFSTYNGSPANKLMLLKGEASAPADPFATFVASLPEGERGENDDFDGDGVPNLIEFVFGTAPGTFNPRPAMPSTTAPGSSISGMLDPAKIYRIVEVETPKNTRGVALALGVSQNLSFTDGAAATEIPPRTDNGSTETRRYYLTPATDDAPVLFWRLEGTR